MAKQNIDEVISEIKADLKGNVKNVFSKLQICRVELAQMNLKKSGLNKHNKIPYYELKDFLPSAMQLFVKHGLCSRFTDLGEFCELDIFDSENPENSINFKSKNTESKVPGATAIQSQGALLTYQRRYLYFSALEIVESDYFDGSDYGNKQSQQPQQPQQPKYISNNEIGDIQKQLLDIKATEKQIGWLFDVLKVDSFDMILENDLPKAKTAISKITETNKEKSNGK